MEIIDDVERVSCIFGGVLLVLCGDLVTVAMGQESGRNRGLVINLAGDVQSLFMAAEFCDGDESGVLL